MGVSAGDVCVVVLSDDGGAVVEVVEVDKVAVGVGCGVVVGSCCWPLQPVRTSIVRATRGNSDLGIGFIPFAHEIWIRTGHRTVYQYSFPFFPFLTPFMNAAKRLLDFFFLFLGLGGFFEVDLVVVDFFVVDLDDAGFAVERVAFRLTEAWRL